MRPGEVVELEMQGDRRNVVFDLPGERVGQPGVAPQVQAAPPPPSGSFPQLLAVSSASPADVWRVGAQSGDHGQETLVERRCAP